MATPQSSEPGLIGPDTKVSRLMTRAVARISSEAGLRELARKLSAVGAGAMGVGSEQGLIGIVSERDLTVAYARSEDPETITVGDIVSTDIIWCDPDASASTAAQLMVARNVRHLLVGDGQADDLQGIVSARDLIGALVGS